MTEHGEFPWLKISLGRIFCVQTVVRRNNEDEIWQTWTCTERECSGVGNNVGKFRVTINTEGATLDLPPISDCSFGDTVTYGRKNNNSLGAREIVIIAREPMEVLYLGKIRLTSAPYRWQKFIKSINRVRYFREGSQISANQRQENIASSFLIG